MKSVKTVFSIAFSNIKKWRTNIRMWFLLFYVLYFVYFITENVPTGVAKMGVKISCWIFPFYMTNWPIIILYLTIPLVILFCDAPFLDDSQPYILIRCKRKIWVWGQILYVVIASFIYVFVLEIVTIIENIGVMELTADWGSFIESPKGNEMLAVNPLGYLFINDYILTNFTPLQAMLFSFLYFWLAAILIGLLMFCLNSITNSRVIGGVCASLMVVIGYLGNGRYYNLNWISPVSWLSLTNVDVGGQTNNPSFTYTMIFYAVVFAVMITVILIHNRKRTIEVLPPV